MTEELKLIVRIANVDLDGKKPIGYALKKIKGVSFSFANAVCLQTNVDKSKKTGNLTDDEIKKLTDAITNPSKYKLPKWLLNRRMDYETGEDKHLLAADLDFTKSSDIRRYKKIKLNLKILRRRRRTLRPRSNSSESSIFVQGRIDGAKWAALYYHHIGFLAGWNR